MDDSVYRATYRAHVENLLGTVFEPSRLNARLQSEHARVAPFVIGTSGELAGRSFAGTPAEFDGTVFGPTGLIAYVYPEWDVSPGTGRLTYDTQEVRRARVGVDGRVKQVSFELTVDPQDEDDGTVLKDAYAQMRFNRAIRLRVGQFKLPGGREDQTSARSSDFMERSAFSNTVTAGPDIGAMSR